MSSLLFSLPQEIFRIILGYLPFLDLGRVDMAVLNHSYRSYFLLTLQGLHIIKFEAFLRKKSKENYLQWLVLRKIVVVEIFLHYLHPLMFSLIQNSRSHLRTLRFFFQELSNVYFQSLATLPALTDLDLGDCDELCQELLIEFFQLNPHLPKLSISSSSPYTPSLMTYLPTNLTYLDVSESLWFNDQCVSILSKSQLRLSYLNISYTDVHEDSSIELIINAFPSLYYLLFYECDISDDMVKLSLHRVISPSIRSDQLDHQCAGITCLQQILHERQEAIEEEISSLNLIPIILTYFSHPERELRSFTQNFFWRRTHLIFDLDLFPQLLQIARTHPDLVHLRAFMLRLTECESQRIPYNLSFMSLIATYFHLVFQINSVEKQIEQLFNFLFYAIRHLDPKLLIASDIFLRLLQHSTGPHNYHREDIHQLLNQMIHLSSQDENQELYIHLQGLLQPGLSKR